MLAIAASKTSAENENKPQPNSLKKVFNKNKCIIICRALVCPSVWVLVTVCLLREFGSARGRYLEAGLWLNNWNKLCVCTTPCHLCACMQQSKMKCKALLGGSHSTWYAFVFVVKLNQEVDCQESIVAHDLNFAVHRIRVAILPGFPQMVWKSKKLSRIWRIGLMASQMLKCLGIY